jgi:hypothetical protein
LSKDGGPVTEYTVPATGFIFSALPAALQTAAAASGVTVSYSATTGKFLFTSPTAGNAVVTSGSFVVGTPYTIVSIGTTNYTLIGAASNTPGLGFTATGVGTGTGTASVASSVVVSPGSTGVDVFANITATVAGTSVTRDPVVAAIAGANAGLAGTATPSFPIAKALVNGNENNVTTTGILTLSTIVAGTTYVNGTYTNVPLTGGSGTGAAATIVVSGTVVTGVTLTDSGVGYTAGNVLSALAANIGGTGSGFTVTAATVAIGGSVFSNWNDVMQQWPSPAGYGALWTVGGSANTFKQFTPSAKGRIVRTAVYYNGTNWVYYANGVTLAGNAAPPELAP